MYGRLGPVTQYHSQKKISLGTSEIEPFTPNYTFQPLSDSDTNFAHIPIGTNIILCNFFLKLLFLRFYLTII